MRHLTNMTASVLLALWSACAWAATETFGHQLGQIPASAFLAVVMLSVIPAVYNVLRRIEAGKMPPGRMLWVAIVSEIMASLIAGFLTFFFIEASRPTVPISEWLEAGAIGISGYLGARVINRYASKAEQVIDGVKLPGA